MSLIAFEFHDYGFGPASTSAALIAKEPALANCTLISTGGALRFAQRQFPTHPTIDLDTYRDPEGCARTLSRLLPPNSLLISNSHPRFADAALRLNMRVGVVEILDWLWPSLPASLSQAAFHIVQQALPNVRPLHGVAVEQRPLVEWTRPFIDERRWAPPTSRPNDGQVIIGLAGMSFPVAPDIPGRYSHWVARNVIPELLASGRCKQVLVAGGALGLEAMLQESKAPALDDSRVVIVGPMSPSDYADAVKSSEFQLLAPGLTSIYEAAFAEIRPLFLPGYNISAVLQAHQLVDIYKSVVEWPNVRNIVLSATSNRRNIQAEAVAAQAVSRSLTEISDGHPSSEITRAITQYLETTWAERPDLSVVYPYHLPRPQAILSKGLKMAHSPLAERGLNG